jgi:hypothetical protein
LFWKDDWLDQIISEKFPRAFSYCLHEDISVQKFLTAPTLSDNFSLPLSPEALQEVKDLQEEAASTVLSLLIKILGPMCGVLLFTLQGGIINTASGKLFHMELSNGFGN